MSADYWSHLEEVVAALVAAGNKKLDGGFRVTQGGMDCALKRPLDRDVAQHFADLDPRIHFDAEKDELFCEHCWAGIHGGAATARYLREYRAAKRQRPVK